MDLDKVHRIRVVIVVMVALLLATNGIGSIIIMCGGELIGFLIEMPLAHVLKFSVRFPGVSALLTGMTVNLILDVGLLVSLFHRYRIFQKLWIMRGILICLGLIQGFYYLAFEEHNGIAVAMLVGLAYMAALTVLALIFHERGDQLLSDKRRENNPPAYDREHLIV